jgi:hypothetical protein
MFSNRATQCIVVSLNVSSVESLITADVLLGIFRQEVDWKPWVSHLDDFFEHLPTALIHRFMEENDLDFERLSRIYLLLPPVNKGKLFKWARNLRLEGSFSKGAK